MSGSKRSARAFADRRGMAALLLSPAGIVILAVTIVPIVVMVFTSFTNFNQRSLFTGSYDMVGFDQFAAVLSNPEFWASFVRTILFTAALVLGSVGIGVGMSHILTRVGAVLRTIVTVVLIFAWAMPNVAASLVWNWLFQPGYGVVNWMLTQIGIFGDMTDTDWSADPLHAFTAIWLLIVWQAVPFIALTVYAAETQVGAEYIEAARLDGASEFRVYRSVTLPFLRPTIMLVTILSTIWNFNIFNQIWLISHGGPNGATATLGVFTYITAFVSFDIGGGSAIAVITTILLAVVTSFYIRSLVRSGEDL